MKPIFLIFLLVLFFLNSVYSQDSVRIYGRVTDFESQPIDSVSVRLKNKNFENLYEVLTDKKGYFSFKVLKGNYYCLYAIRVPDYAKTKLEYWAWNIPAYTDLEINPQYDRMEIYGVNAFEPQVSPWDTYMVYFRPMSLTKGLHPQKKKKEKNKNNAKKNLPDTIDIAPSKIEKEELQVFINDAEADVLNITKLLEYARGAYIYGYLIQILKPKEKDTEKLYDKITIILHSKETGDKGKGEYFIKRIK